MEGDFGVLLYRDPFSVFKRRKSLDAHHGNVIQLPAFFQREAQLLFAALQAADVLHRGPLVRQREGAVRSQINMIASNVILYSPSSPLSILGCKSLN